MSFYWIQFIDRSGGTVRAKDKDDAVAKVTLMTGKVIVAADVLPYPASPALEELNHPAFCFSPETCRGRTSCPKRIACSE